MEMKHVVVIVPCFNEAKRLKKTFDIINSWEPKTIVPKFVFVDDGSSDATSKKITEIKFDRFESVAVSLPYNSGKGGAIQSAMPYISNQNFCHWDADASIDIECIETGFIQLHEGNNDISIANRKLDKSFERNASKYRNVLSKIFAIYSKNVLRPYMFTDSQCGLKIYSNNMKYLFETLQEKRFLFDLEILVKAKKQGYIIKEFPVTWQHVDGGSVSLRKAMVNALIGPWQIKKTISSY